MFGAWSDTNGKWTRPVALALHTWKFGAACFVVRWADGNGLLFGVNYRLCTVHRTVGCWTDFIVLRCLCLPLALAPSALSLNLFEINDRVYYFGGVQRVNLMGASGVLFTSRRIRFSSKRILSLWWQRLLRWKSLGRSRLGFSTFSTRLGEQRKATSFICLISV